MGKAERAMLNVETQQLTAEIDRIADSTKYLGTHLLNGSGRDFVFHIGPDADETNQIAFDTSDIDLRSNSLGVEDLDLTDKDSSLEGFEAVDEAITRLHLPQANLGAMQTRMSIAINHLLTYDENLTAANSRIRDADLAQETTNMIQAQIQQKAAIAVMAQANLLPSMALRLIEG